MDVCFSNWRAYFGPGLEFAYAYDFDSLVAHYRQYRKVMAHWHAALPGEILDVDYARLVREPEAVAREILGRCGLEYEPGCTDLTRNRAPSATLSMPQVREPIHTRSFEEWHPYATQLAGLRQALGKP
ncbi:MAG: sulfotransferase, partial [Proteobacteria bacterium]|nr:sulfotransferase [Pseudomonadota bacterium]